MEDINATNKERVSTFVHAEARTKVRIRYS
jgi:hypothetical protein